MRLPREPRLDEAPPADAERHPPPRPRPARQDGRRRADAGRASIHARPTALTSRLIVRHHAYTPGRVDAGTTVGPHRCLVATERFHLIQDSELRSLPCKHPGSVGRTDARGPACDDSRAVVGVDAHAVLIPHASPIFGADGGAVAPVARHVIATDVLRGEEMRLSKGPLRHRVADRPPPVSGAGARQLRHRARRAASALPTAGAANRLQPRDELIERARRDARRYLRSRQPASTPLPRKTTRARRSGAGEATRRLKLAADEPAS